MVAGVQRAWRAAGSTTSVSIGYPGPGAAQPAGRRAAQPRPGLGRLRLRGGVRLSGQDRQRRRDAGAGQLQRRQDALPGPRHRLGLRDDRGRRRWSRWSSRTCPTARRRTRTMSACVALESDGKKKWRKNVADVVARLAAALEPEDVVLGGGNASMLEEAAARVPAGRQRQRIPRRLPPVEGCGAPPTRARKRAAPARHAARQGEASKPMTQAACAAHSATGLEGARSALRSHART